VFTSLESFKAFIQGSLPGWAVVVILVGSLIKIWPIIQRNLLDARDKRDHRYSTRISELERAVHECQKECEDHKNELRKEISGLTETIMGLRRQHVQEQISLITAIIESVDNPLLKKLMKSLESVQRALPREIPGVAGDAGKTPR
jgi:hypothetical protein